MLPIPFSKYIPKLFRDNQQAETTAMCDKADVNLQAWLNDVVALQYLPDADRCPYDGLKYLDAMLLAGVRSEDSNRQKRVKVLVAVSTHKSRGTWQFDAKLRIDAISGYEADFYRLSDIDDSIEMAGLSYEPLDSWWSTESAYEESDGDLGTWEIGSFVEPVIAGNIYIDCHSGVHTPVLSTEVIQQIVSNIENDIVPAYVRIFLGYRDTTGGFVTYSGGIIE